eukprot:1185945-Prorocentrum_minimum.AAC.8
MKAANGALPPSLVINVAAALYKVLKVVGGEVFRTWLEAALARNPEFPKAGVTDIAKAAFVTSLVTPPCCGDVRLFKRALKGFCGGKKKGVSG